MAEQIVGGFTNSYTAVRRHKRNSGLLAIPLAGDDDSLPVEIVSVSSPFEEWEVVYSAEAEGMPPRVPSANNLDVNTHFISGVREGNIPMACEDGTGHRFVVSGAYRYITVSPVGFSTPLPTGTMPFESVRTDPGRYTIPAQNFDINILGNIDKGGEAG